MKESTWEECLESNSSLNVTPNQAKARSLIETVQGRNEYLKENIIKEANASFIFEGYYSSVLELLHALVLLDGYKVSNHICLGYYLRDILKRNDLFQIFDENFFYYDKADKKLEVYDKKHLFVLSGVGVKEYYRKLGFNDNSVYLSKTII